MPPRPDLPAVHRRAAPATATRWPRPLVLRTAPTASPQHRRPPARARPRPAPASAPRPAIWAADSRPRASPPATPRPDPAAPDDPPWPGHPRHRG
ncbi:MAG TPA: hypothetical protein DCX75_09675 [Brevundimonas sp.]|nr:hypothetical protein [Brevundimonas sp.]